MENIHNISNKLGLDISEPVVIFGACRAGLYHHSVLKYLNFEINCFIDNSVKKFGREYLGREVLRPEEGVAKFGDATFILALMNGANVRKAKSQLVDLGVEEKKIKFVSPDVVLLYTQLFSQRKLNIEKYERYKHDLFNHTGLQRNHQLAPSFTVIVTERCNLACENCMAFVPQNKEPTTFGADEIIESVRKYAASFEYVYRVCLMGGEPFVHKEFAKIVDGISQIENILFIDIATNGTVVPPPGLMQVLKKYGLGVEISDYGVVSRKMSELFRECEREGVVFYHQDYSEKQWTELGLLPKQNRDYVTNRTRFIECSQYLTNHVRDGRLYRCVFSAMVDKLGYIETPNSDYVDLLNSGDQTISQKIHDFTFRTEPLAACDICMGLDRAKVKPGIQPQKNLNSAIK